MKPEFAQWLKCLNCGGSFELEAGQCLGEDVEEGKLRCRCGIVVPIANGVPRFVGTDAYTTSFTFEWHRHRRTQFDSNRSRESEARLCQITGFSPADLAGKRVLDAGIGAGRFADVIVRHGGTVVGVDLSYAIDVARENLGSHQSAHLLQADLLNLPLKPGTFDLIFSIGVIMTTADARRTFLRLAPLLKPGGTIAIWVYDGYDKIRGASNDFYRRFTTRLPHRLVYALSHIAVPLYYLYRIPGFGSIALKLLPISRHANWRWRVLDTFDSYAMTYQSRHRYPEVCQWFQDAGLTRIEPREPPVAMRGQRPMSGQGQLAV
jgi:SAM-dependent methyltransferase